MNLDTPYLQAKKELSMRQRIGPISLGIAPRPRVYESE